MKTRDRPNVLFIAVDDLRTQLRCYGDKYALTPNNVYRLVEFVDIYPTLCNLCHLPIPEGLEGISMVPLMQDPKRPWKLAAFSQFPRGPGAPGQDPDAESRRIMGYTMRTELYRYTEWVDQDSGRAVAEELYDHQNDPQENVNIASRPENKGPVGKLREQLSAGWQAALPPEGMALDQGPDVLG